MTIKGFKLLDQQCFTPRQCGNLDVVRTWIFDNDVIIFNDGGKKHAVHFQGGGSTECKKLRKMLLKPPGVNLFNSNFNVGHASQFPQCSTKRNIALLLVKEKKLHLYVQRIWS